ncbi:hypothetical protein LP421_28830 [Rhizobium sp. RCAM05350]|nr:hypothetical protein LP421_28830 [Rhizobium sp. RCAM05350]
MKTIVLNGNPLDFSALEKIGSGLFVPVVAEQSFSNGWRPRTKLSPIGSPWACQFTAPIPVSAR